MLRNWTARRWVVVLGALALVGGGGLWLVSASAVAGVPDEFTNRPSLSDCGRADLTVARADGRAEGIDCLDAALTEGAGAELVVVRSVEGDPITQYYRALPGGGLEVFYDNRQDALRGADWHHAHCPEARSFRELGDCGYRGL